ncbi:late competence development ComFB family protein [Oscillospiraceae bacterium MB08-C2-2]|nr:late competence development ComFB family protein [Oscillospiraceae bacterium MB08-C2-2]
MNNTAIESNMENPHSKYVLINAYDDIVKTMVRQFMDKTEMCRCEKCFLDVCALVFNRQYTHFVTTREGALLAKVPEMNHGNRVEMTVVVMDAIRIVKNFPKH